jgi:hypothetical protein
MPKKRGVVVQEWLADLPAYLRMSEAGQSPRQIVAVALHPAGPAGRLRNQARPQSVLAHIVGIMASSFYRRPTK